MSVRQMLSAVIFVKMQFLSLVPDQWLDHFSSTTMVNCSIFRLLIYPFQGNVNYEIDFEFGAGTGMTNGCGVSFKGEFWYFGGRGWDRNGRNGFNAQVHLLY